MRSYFISSQNMEQKLVLKTWSRNLQHLQESGVESLSQLDLQHNGCGTRNSHVVHVHGVCYYWRLKNYKQTKNNP